MSLNPDIAFSQSLKNSKNLEGDAGHSAAPALAQKSQSQASLTGTLTTISNDGSETKRTFESLTAAVAHAISHNQFSDANAHSTAGKIARTIGQAFLLLGVFLVSLVVIDPIRYLLFKKEIINGQLNQTVQKTLDFVKPEYDPIKASAQRIEAAALDYQREVTKPGANADRAKLNLQNAVDREVARLKRFLSKADLLEEPESIINELCGEIGARLQGKNLVLSAGDLRPEKTLTLSNVIIFGATEHELGGAIAGFRGIANQFEAYSFDSPLNTADKANQDFDDLSTDKRLFPSLGRTGRAGSFGELHDLYSRQFSRMPSLSEESEISDDESALEDSYDLIPEHQEVQKKIKADQAGVDAYAAARRELEAPLIDIPSDLFNVANENQVAKLPKAQKQANFDKRLDALIKGFEADKAKLLQLNSIASGAVDLSRKLSDAIFKQEMLYTELREAIVGAEGELMRQSIQELLVPPEKPFASESLNAKARAKLSNSASKQNSSKSRIQNTWAQIQEMNIEISSIYDQVLDQRSITEDLFADFIVSNSRISEEALLQANTIRNNHRSKEFERLRNETQVLLNKVKLQIETIDEFETLNDADIDRNIKAYFDILEFTTATPQEREALARKQVDHFIDEAVPALGDEDLSLLSDDEEGSFTDKPSVESGEDVDFWLTGRAKTKEKAASKDDESSVSGSESFHSTTSPVADQIDDLIDAANPENEADEVLSDFENHQVRSPKKAASKDDESSVSGSESFHSTTSPVADLIDDLIDAANPENEADEVLSDFENHQVRSPKKAASNNGSLSPILGKPMFTKKQTRTGGRSTGKAGRQIVRAVGRRVRFAAN